MPSDDNRSGPSLVPVYKLYGEHEQWLTPDMVHCESIADRSKLHDWQIKLHQHHGLTQVLYLKGGSARVCLDGKYVDMHPGQIVVVPQMCVHGFRFAPNAQGHVVTLAYPLINKISESLGLAHATTGRPYIYAVQDDTGPHVDMAFSTLDVEYRGSGVHRNLLMEAMLTTIFIWLSRHAAHATHEELKEQDRGRRHFQKFSQLIETDFANQLSVEQCAKKLGITAAYLNVLCRQIVGQSALELIHQRVVLAAKRNLVYTSMTISVVSYTLGFTDPAYFTRFFKRHVGLSPKQFRQQAATLLE